MKKKHKSALSVFATRLPESYQIIKATDYARGYDMPGANETKNYDPEAVYKRTGEKLVKIDHLKRLQKAYSRNKEQGIIDYVFWLQENNKRVNERYKDLKLNDIDKNIIALMKKGVGNFWKNLIMFLYSFVKIFQNEQTQKS